MILVTLASTAFAERPKIEVGDLFEAEVLDVNATHGALKLVHAVAQVDDGADPKKCDYAGMKDHPTAGVDLFVVELASGKIERFTVYEAVREEADFQMEPARPCTPHATSEKVLAQAKARMAEVGLDPTKKPQPSEGKVTVGEKTVYVLDAIQSVRDEEMISNTHTWTVTRDGVLVHRSARTYSSQMAGHGEHVGHGVWAVPDGFVMLEHWKSGNMRGSGHELSFTPRLPLE